MQNKQKRIYIFLNKKEKDKENKIKKSQRKSLETTMKIKILLDSSSSIFSWLLFVLLKLNTFLEIIQFIILSNTRPFEHFK